MLWWLLGVVVLEGATLVRRVGCVVVAHDLSNQNLSLLHVEFPHKIRKLERSK